MPFTTAQLLNEAKSLSVIGNRYNGNNTVFNRKQ